MRTSTVLIALGSFVAIATAPGRTLAQDTTQTEPVAGPRPTASPAPGAAGGAPQSRNNATLTNRWVLGAGALGAVAGGVIGYSNWSDEPPNPWGCGPLALSCEKEPQSRTEATVTGAVIGGVVTGGIAYLVVRSNNRRTVPSRRLAVKRVDRTGVMFAASF